MPRPIHYGQRAKINLGTQQKQITAPADKPTLPTRDEVVREIVLNNIGTPDDLLEVQIKELWNDKRYRVNVFREVKGERRMTNSYFLSIEEDGVVGSPPLDRITSDDILAGLSASA